MFDLTGQRFGRLTVIKRFGSDKSKNATWLCQCDCGNEFIAAGIRLRRGETRSCGCLQKEVVTNRMLTHGLSKTRLYRVWAGIKSRCYNPKCDNYRYYGAKGITMCNEWREDFTSFAKWSEKSGYDKNADAQKCTIDRIDNTKPYCPENCRWVNHIVQCNNMSCNKTFEYNGEVLTMAEAARKFEIPYTTLRARIRRGVSFEQAIQ